MTLAYENNGCLKDCLKDGLKEYRQWSSVVSPLPLHLEELVIEPQMTENISFSLGKCEV